MERQQFNSLQNFDEPKTEILKKRLLKCANGPVTTNLSLNSSQHNVLLNTLRAPISSSMIVSSVQAPQSSMPITHNLVTHSIAPMKIHANNATYPLQLSTVHVPVQIPGSNSNINVPVQLSGPTNTVPLQIAPVSLPLQVSGTASVPVQLPAGETINVPLQIPAASQNIQLTGAPLPSMPILQNTSQPLHSSIFHVHMGTNPRSSNMDRTSDMTVTSSSQLQIPDSSVQVKLNNPTTMSQVQLGTTGMQIPSSSNNSIQLTLPNTGSSGTVQLRGATRPVPHVVYIQTPTGLKPVTSSEVISQASTSGNPPQIIVRRPVTSNSNILISNVGNKPNIAPKMPVNKSSILAPVNPTQPIVIQKPKSNEKMIVPVSIAPGNQGKQAIAYLGSVKKPNSKNMSDNQSILISNNQSNVSSNNQKLFLTPMNVPKIQNTKFILPVTLPATMASKGPFINLQIANGQIQNDPQGNITVMRDSTPMEAADMPPLQPLAKVISSNGKDTSVPQSPKGEKTFFSISGSRAEPTGEQGEYTLSIPETNASMNDDIYTVSIADDEGGQTREKSFTLAIPEKGKSLLNRNMHHMHERNDMGPVTIAAPAILRRSNSDNSDRKTTNANMKRRISLCNENLTSKNIKLTLSQHKIEKSDDQPDCENNDDHRVPSLFCDEKLDKDLEAKVNLGDSDHEDFKEIKPETTPERNNHDSYYRKMDNFIKKEDNFNIQAVKEKLENTLEEDPPGLIWNNGVALLQGSNLQFQTNEFGMIDLIDTSDQEEILVNPGTKYHTPLKQRIERNNREKKRTSPEDMYRCDGCGCHGMAAEFITPNFCSSTCQNDVQKALQKKRDKERAELSKKRNKMKKLFMRKHLSESDIMSDKDDKVPLKHYDSTPAESQSDDALKIEDMVVNEKYPWMCGKNGFSWMRYLDICKAKAAPVKLFKDPFPYQHRNGFKVGMRLEAIDPQHSSLFCVVSVAEVQGYRMRLHFDGYPDLYDYWVNADSIDIFPPGWCEKNGRSLKPPANCSGSSFSWPLYLKQMRAIAAPKHLFPHITNTIFKPNCFRIGMKLEAEDRKNELVCVASIADMMDNRMLINFDSWDEMYDYWVDPTSPYIHPVGWAEENGISLTPPNFYKDPDQFSWENYLSETGASAAPPRAFKTRPPQGFKPGMKLEVVDSRVPFLIRVATINEVKGHQVRVSFDGWPEDLSSWMDDDSPELHPVGWCLKTGHPLEPPLTEEELRISGPCGVGGCRGLGSVRGGAHKQHNAASACPYRPRRPAPPPDRLAPVAAGTDHALPKSRRYTTVTNNTTTSACVYRPRRPAPPPDRLAPVAAGTDHALPKSRRYTTVTNNTTTSACVYRPRRPAPPPDRLAPVAAGTDHALPKSRRYTTVTNNTTTSACVYRPRRPAPPPDRLAPVAAGTNHALPKSRRYTTVTNNTTTSACVYRPRRPAPPPDRLAPVAAGTDHALPKSRRYTTVTNNTTTSACVYRPRRPAPPPDRLAPVAAGTDHALPKSRRYTTVTNNTTTSACVYRPRRPAPPPDRLAPVAAGTDHALPKSRRYTTVTNNTTTSACVYRPRRPAPPPDRLAPVAAGTDHALPKSRRYTTVTNNTTTSACVYRPRRPAPPPDRLAPVAAGTDHALPKSRRYTTVTNNTTTSACVYRPRRPAPPPDRLAPVAAGTNHALPKSRRYTTVTNNTTTSACVYRPRRPAPPPDRLAPVAAGTDHALPKSRRYTTVTNNTTTSACVYRPRRPAPPPDRLAPVAAGTDHALPKSRRYTTVTNNTTTSACVYRPRRPAPPPDRLAPVAAGTDHALPKSRRYTTVTNNTTTSACVYRPRRPAPPPDRLAPVAAGTDHALPKSRRYTTVTNNTTTSACVYRPRRPAPPPDRLAPVAAGTDHALPKSRRYTTVTNNTTTSACVYRPRRPAPPPDRLAPVAAGTDHALPKSRRYTTVTNNTTTSACVYRPRRPAPPPDRLAPVAAGTDHALPKSRRYTTVTNNTTTSACVYRPRRPAPPPDRLAPVAAGTDHALPKSRRYTTVTNNTTTSACVYRPRRPAPPPDRLAPVAAGTDHALPKSRRVVAKPTKSIHTSTPTSDSKEKAQRGRPPKHKRVEEVTKNEPASDEESVSSGGWKRWRSGSARAEPCALRTYSRASAAPPASNPEGPSAPSAPSAPSGAAPPRTLAHVATHIAELALPPDPTTWSQGDVATLVGRLGGSPAGSAALAARLSGAELLMASCEELVSCLRLRLGPAIKVYAAVRQLRDSFT